MIVVPAAGPIVAMVLLAARAVYVRDAAFALLWTAVPLAAALATLRTPSAESVAAFAAGLHLGLLLAKGFVERSPWRGRIVPFALLSGVLGAVGCGPWIAARLQPGAWPASFAAAALTSAWVALAYRLVSLRTDRDPEKLLWLLPACAAAFLWRT